jgi:4-hydroxybenzoate polyprenyltransferase
LFILSGGFLLGGFLSSDLEPKMYLLQFLNVHLLLFGGATAYNSYWDRDEGPIGGLRNPPEMRGWMWGVAWGIQIVGLLLAVPLGGLYAGIFILSMLFFWLYSTPLARWKARPLKCLVVIGLSTGSNVVLLRYLAAGNQQLSLLVIVAALGVSLILLSLYPISQIYQLEEDRDRRDQTFAVQSGTAAVCRFFDISFLTGLLIISISIGLQHLFLGILFGFTGIVIGFWLRSGIYKLRAEKEDYEQVMKMKYGTSMAFVTFLLIVMVLKHSRLNELFSFVDLLLK